MSQHPNARLTPWGRQRLVERIEAGEAVDQPLTAPRREACVRML